MSWIYLLKHRFGAKLLAVPVIQDQMPRYLTLIFLTALLSGCCPRWIQAMKNPADAGLHFADPTAVTKSETGLLVRPTTMTGKVGQMMYRRSINGIPFVIHYYFDDEVLQGVNYYYNDSPYGKCARYRTVYDALYKELRVKYGDPTTESTEMHDGPEGAQSCHVSAVWHRSGQTIALRLYGNDLYDFDEVGIRYNFASEGRENN